jgi:hypothetical protein
VGFVSSSSATSYVFIHTRGGIKMHPGVKDELACRGFVCRTLHRLGLNVETIKPMADRRLALVGCHQSMPTRRTPIDRGRRVQITPAMVALWKRGQEILATKAEQKWEEEGGRRREFLDLAVELHELLDRRPWEVDVFYVDAMKPSDDQDQGDWVGAAAARRALVAALQQQSG